MNPIIILGSGVNLDGTMGQNQMAQVDLAKSLLGASRGDVIITTGSYGYKQDQRPVITEAVAYRNYAVSIGVPTEKIYTEENSMETVGNLLFVKQNIMIPKKWTKFIVIPGYNHSDERIEYIIRKVYGPAYTWRVIRAGKNDDPANSAREQRSMDITTRIINPVTNGDHETIAKLLYLNHPAYNPNAILNLEDLKKHLS